MTSLIACASCLLHDLPASIAKILDHCVVAMFSGMLRLHLCDVAVASHRAQVMFVSAQAHAHRHEQCAMACDPRTNRTGNIDSAHQTSMVVALHSNLGRFVLVDLLVGAGECGLPWVSFRCGQHGVVSSTAVIESFKFPRARCDDHASAGRHWCRGCFVSFICDVISCYNSVNAKSCCFLVLHEIFRAHYRCHVAVMGSCG